MGFETAALEIEIALHSILASLDDAKRTRHTQMHQQGVTRREIGQQILCASPQRVHFLSLETRREVARKWRSQIGAARLDALDASAFHDAAQLTTNGFDFGEFGHDPG